MKLSLPQFSFANLCRGHAAIDLLLGATILYNVDFAATAVHGSNAAKQLFGGDDDNKNGLEQKKEDKVSLRVAESCVGLLLVDIGVLLSIISTCTVEEVQRLTCQCALGIHGMMIAWRLFYQSKVEAVRKDIPSQIVSDIVFASSWAMYWYNMTKK